MAHRPLRKPSPARILRTALLLGLAGSILATGTPARADDGRSAGTKNGAKQHKKKEPAGNGSASSAEALARATRAIRQGEHERARSMIRTALRATKSTGVKDNWRLVEAELEFALDNYARSALLAMRIVILRPESDHVGKALYRAALAYEKLGRPAKALDLYRECAAHKTTKATVKSRAEKRIAVLSPSETAE